MKEKFRELWDHHEHIMNEAPKRSVYWGLHKTLEEAQEWEVTDPNINEDQFLDEGSDIIISYMTTMKTAGYSYEVALEAVKLKMNVIIDRMIDANILSKGGAMSWDDAYQGIKELE